MLQDGLSDEFEDDLRRLVASPNFDLLVIRHPGGPYAGVELYLPTAVALFIAAGFFNGFLSEAGKDAYIAFKGAVATLWEKSSRLRTASVGSAGKVDAGKLYSLSYSITGEVTPGLNFKLVLRKDIDAAGARQAIEAFLDLFNDILSDRISEPDARALLAFRPVGGTVLVTFDLELGRIIPVNAFQNRAAE